MTFFEIELKSIPKILFCGDFIVENYKNSFRERTDFLELTLILEGGYYRIYNDKSKDICEPETFSFINKQSDYDTVAFNNELQRHITVGVEAEYNCIKRNISDCNDIERIKRDIIQKGTILIPDMVKLEEYREKTNSILKEIIWAKMSNNPRSVPYAMHSLYKLFALLSEFTLDRIEKRNSNVAPNVLSYVEKAKKYIEKHYAEKITVKDISTHIGVSEGYFYDIFKKVTGLTVLQHINRHRVDVFINYVKDYGLNLNEASLHVGIDDPAYMSRLFKKVKGMSFRKYFDKIQ